MAINQPDRKLFSNVMSTKFHLYLTIKGPILSFYIVFDGLKELQGAEKSYWVFWPCALGPQQRVRQHSAMHAFSFWRSQKFVPFPCYSEISIFEPYRNRQFGKFVLKSRRSGIVMVRNFVGRNSVS